MTRRLHTTELGFIAGVDLSDLGAGKEGWLVETPNLLVALDTDFLAIANRSLILLVNWSQSIEGRRNQAVEIIPELSPIEAEYISAIEWFVFEDDVRVLAVGSSCGYFLIFSVHGTLIYRQIVYHGKILKLRMHAIKQDLTLDASSEEVCIVMPGVIARFEGSDIKKLLQRRFQETSSEFWDHDFYDNEDSGNSFSSLPYQLWNVSKYGFCADAAIIGVMPPPLMEIQSSERYYCAVTIGDDAVISAFRLSVDRSRSIVGAILSKVVPATFSTIASFSKLIWRTEPNHKKKPEAISQSFTRDLNFSAQLSCYAINCTLKKSYFMATSPLTCLKDHPRKGEKLTLSPSGTLAAITDSLGRILLLDTQALVVVRLWKGYREATCLFVEMLATKDKTIPTPPKCTKSDYCPCLAIHAPRKGIVEVWQMRTGPRLLTIPCPKGDRILQPTYRYSSSSESSSYVPLQVFLMNGDSGEISVLNRSTS